MVTDINYYNMHGFENVSDETALTKALYRSEQLIDVMTDGKCSDFQALDETRLSGLKQAICLQAEFYLADGYVSGGGRKVTLGDFFYQEDDFGGCRIISPVALAVLKLGGLYDCGVCAV